MSKLKEGQILYLKNKNEIKECIVNKVGRKYFTLKNDYIYNKYDIATLLQIKNCGSPIQLYLSKQDIVDKNRFNDLTISFRNIFGNLGFSHNLTLEQLERINKVLEENVNEK